MLSTSSNNNTNDESETVLYILNPTNVLITKEYITQTFKKYGLNVKLKDINPYQKAVTHKSYLVRDPEYDEKNKKLMAGKERGYEPLTSTEGVVPLQERCYERLEFLGDSVIHLVLADYLYHRYKNEYEGFMTRLRTKIENCESLAQLCIAIGLNKYVLISRAMELHDARVTNVSVLEDAFEAFIGAMYSMYDFNTCKTFITNVIEKEIDFAEILCKETNYKDTLLQYYHKNKWSDPTYGLVEKSGPDHKKIFKMFVKDQYQNIIGVGEGNSKKKGEQEAARKALIHFGELKDDDESSDGEMYDLSDLSDLEDL